MNNKEWIDGFVDAVITMNKFGGIGRPETFEVAIFGSIVVIDWVDSYGYHNGEPYEKRRSEAKNSAELTHAQLAEWITSCQEEAISREYQNFEV